MHASMNNGDLDHQQSNHFMHNASDVSSSDTTLKDNQETVMTSENSPLQQLVKEEEMERGHVSFKVYWAYATAIAGGAFVPVYLVALIGFQVFQILSSYWMAWGTACLLVRALTVSIIGLKTAQKYYLKMLRSIFRASMSFFDSTPSGRILTRVCVPLFPLTFYFR
jgi:ATP-binding cassette subfamily C (CFTR/MRP) protein 2